MNTFTVSITELKHNISDIINRVNYEKKEAVVKRHGKTVVHIIPHKETPSKTKGKKSLAKALEETFGAIPDFPDVTKFRRNKRHWRTL